MKGGLGQMPLTLFIIVAAIVLYFYIRRAHLGIDKHPGEQVTVKPSVPILPPGGGIDWSKGPAPVPGFTMPGKPTIQLPTTVPEQVPGVLN